MDPLSITLTVVSLATALKDMIELGEKIYRSFAKVSDNLRNAQRVAEDIKEMVEEIKVFCEDHKDALDDMKDFDVAVQALLGKFRDFEMSILPLVPQVGRGRHDRIIRGWDAWRNSNRIEESILDLQRNIMKLIRGFMMKSAMRTEVKLETIYQETTRGLEVLEAVRKDLSALFLANSGMHPMYRASEGTSDNFNRNVIMFAQSTSSTSVPMLRTPDVITEELITTAYIKLQIDNIAMTVEKMSKVPISIPNSVKSFCMPVDFDHTSMEIARLRHHIVRQVLTIRNLLDTPEIYTVSVQDGACAMDTLSSALETLGMDRESRLVGEWAVGLARALVTVSGGGQPDLRADLAHYLLNQSIRYNGGGFNRWQSPVHPMRSGNQIRGLQLIEEAYALTQALRNQYSREQYEILHSGVLVQHAGLVDCQRSIEMCVEALQVLEKIINIQAFTWSKPLGQIQIERVVQPSASFFDHLFSLSIPTTAINIYAGALQRLGTSWLDMNAWQLRSYTLSIENGLIKSGIDLQRLAIAVRRQAVSFRGRGHRVYLASSLSFLIQSRAASPIPVTGEVIDMADECIELLRQLVKKNPLFYARRLVDTLWEKARFLETLDRDLEAIRAWEDIAELSGQIVQDSRMCATALGRLSDQFRRLGRHDDAVRTGQMAITTYHELEAETRARRYLYLSRDLQQLRRYRESSEAAQTSVTLYRHLATCDPETWMGHLTEGLAHSAHCLAASGNHSESLIAWEGSTRILESFLDANQDPSPAFINRYLATVRRHKLTSFILEDEDGCLRVSSSTVQHLLWLSEVYPQISGVMEDLLWAEFRHACNLLLVGRLGDAQQYIDNWADVWSSHPEAASESMIVLCHASMLNLKAIVLDAQGYTDQAWLITQCVHGIVGSFFDTYQPCFHAVICSMNQAVQIQVDLGNEERALQIAEQALSLSRDNKLEPIIQGLLWSLHAVTFAAYSCGNYKYAAEAAREGCELATDPYWRKSEGERSSFLRPSLLAILSSAEANLGRYDSALEYAHCAVDASLDIKDRKADISAATAERIYIKAQGNLANILVVTGNKTRARQICEKLHTYYSKRVERHRGDYREWVPILRMLGVLSCNEERHEEGVAFSQELCQILKFLSSAFSSLHEQVKLRLLKYTEVPILTALDGMSLNCSHQAEVASLFTI